VFPPYAVSVQVFQSHWLVITGTADVPFSNYFRAAAFQLRLECASFWVERPIQSLGPLCSESVPWAGGSLSGAPLTTKSQAPSLSVVKEGNGTDPLVSIQVFSRVRRADVLKIYVSAGKLQEYFATSDGRSAECAVAGPEN